MFRPHSLLTLLCLLALSCNEYNVQQKDDGIQDYNSNGAPDIVVDPELVAFGSVNVGDPVQHSEVVTIRNEGTAALHINNLELEDPEAPFQWVNLTSMLVAPEQTAQFDVVFTPVTAEDAETFVFIASDDPDTPQAEVKLTGQGMAPVIQIDPVEYDFGTEFIGCVNPLDVTVTNVGNAPLTVTGFSYNTASTDLTFDGVDPDYAYLVAADDTILLNPSAEVVLNLTYAPVDEYDDVAFLYVTSDDPFTPEVRATQQGAATPYGNGTDIFEQPIEGATDILFALDRSGSMDADLNLVASNFVLFVQTLSGMDADYHVAATVEDSGCINGSSVYIDSTFSATDAEDTMRDMINIGGSYGSNTERGFMLLEAALNETGTGDCNEGFLRDEATLNLIGVSDEREQSANPWSYYVSYFQSLKDDPDNVVFHAVGGDMPSGCGGNEPYEGAYEASVATGGLFLSICAADWATYLQILAEGSAPTLNSFQLTATPVPETVTVRIDGATSTVGWTYNSSQNSVDFETAYIPEGGATIEINYILYGGCEG